MNTTKQSGFHVLEALVVLVVLGCIGFSGYWVMHHGKAPNTASTAASVPQINTAKDLDTASTTVDKIDNSSDLQDINDISKDLDSL